MTTPQRTCFVLMPFADKLREVYEQVYRPACEGHLLKCWRVDEVARPGSITRDIVDGIVDADIVIADLTGKNANVFYELGIAHSVGNKTIMTAQSMDHVPFDIANYRVILYEQSIQGSKKLAMALDQAIRELIASLEQTNNPVQEVFATRSVSGIRKRKALMQVVSVSRLHKGLRDLIIGENIKYVDDLKRVDLEVVRKKYKLGKDNLSNLVRIMLQFEAYRDLEQLQQFIMKHSLSSTGSYRTRDFIIDD